MKARIVNPQRVPTEAGTVNLANLSMVCHAQVHDGPPGSQEFPGVSGLVEMSSFVPNKANFRISGLRMGIEKEDKANRSQLDRGRSRIRFARGAGCGMLWGS
jgi:hypothetical protein